jgi:hypothetical protein
MQVFVRTSLLGLFVAWAKLNFKLGTYSSDHPTTERHMVGFDSATIGLLRVKNRDSVRFRSVRFDEDCCL